VHLDDLLLRRTRLGLLCRDGGEAIIPAVRSICQQELLWSDAQWQEELRRYREIWRQSYSLPGA